MSVQAIGWVFDNSPTSGTDRLVLLAIANHADSEPNGGAWEAWPGVERIRHLAGLERKRTVNDSLTRLVEMGAVERVINGSPDRRIPGDRRPNLYRILLSHGVTPGDTPAEDDGVTSHAQRGDALSANGVTPDDTTGCRDASPKPSLNRHASTSLEPRHANDGPAMLNQAFETFWSRFPSQTGKGAARAAYTKAMRKTSPQVIASGVERYRVSRRVADGVICNPATWLNQERWDDVPEEPQAKVSKSTASLAGWAQRRGGQS